MEIKKNKIIYSPTSNYVACRYIIKNDLSAKDLGLKKKVKSADLKLRIEYGNEHEKKYLKVLSQKYKKTIELFETTQK